VSEINLAEELAGANRTINHLTEAMGWLSGHDRQGLDHLEESMHFAAQLDAIRLAYGEYESALKRRGHFPGAADRFLSVVAAVLDDGGA
jgi:predicted nucleic acid-binding protein